LNFLVNRSKGIVFLESIDAFTIPKTIDKIYTKLDEIVEEVGEEKIVQYAADNVANLQSY